MVVRFIIEGLICIALILGFVFEEKIALWERRKLKKVLKDKPLGQKLERNGVYPYDVKEENYECHLD